MKNAKRKWMKWEKCLYCETPIKTPNFYIYENDSKIGCICDHCVDMIMYNKITEYWKRFEQNRLWWEQRLKDSFKFQELLKIPERQKIISKWAKDIFKGNNKKIADHISQLPPYTEKQMREL